MSKEIKHLNKPIKITNKAGLELLQLCSTTQPDDFKIAYAFMKNINPLKEGLQAYNNKVTDAEIELAFEREGTLVKNDKGTFDYSRENNQKLVNRKRELLEEEFEFIPYMVETRIGLRSFPVGFLSMLEPILEDGFLEKTDTLLNSELKKQEIITA